MKKIVDFFIKHKGKVNKYQITIVIFLIMTFFVGENTLLDGIYYEAKIKSLRADVESLRQDNEEKFQQLKDLQGDRESLEKFAREQFLMTKSDEDIFLIVD